MEKNSTVKMQKTEISAKIVSDSLAPDGSRLTSFVLEFPRIVLAEFNTHRAFARNSASSRAIPYKKMLEKVKNDPFVPIAFQKDHSGMQGTEYFSGEDHEDCVQDWLSARDNAVNSAEAFLHNITKQLKNRLLEPFLWHKVIATATDWQNFFALRANEQAEIHIADLAQKMLNCYNESDPEIMSNYGQWHIPFGDRFDNERLLKIPDTDSIPNNVKISVARCARISYDNFDGKDDYEADIALYERLKSSGHLSPFEHCAYVSLNPKPSNFSGSWQQLRKLIANENRKDSRVIEKATN